MDRVKVKTLRLVKENMLAQLVTFDLTPTFDTSCKDEMVGGQSGPALASGYLRGGAACFLLS